MVFTQSRTRICIASLRFTNHASLPNTQRRPKTNQMEISTIPKPKSRYSFMNELRDGDGKEKNALLDTHTVSLFVTYRRRRTEELIY